MCNLLKKSKLLINIRKRSTEKLQALEKTFFLTSVEHRCKICLYLVLHLMRQKKNLMTMNEKTYWIKKKTYLTDHQLTLFAQKQKEQCGMNWENQDTSALWKISKTQKIIVWVIKWYSWRPVIRTVLYVEPRLPRKMHERQKSGQRCSYFGTWQRIYLKSCSTPHQWDWNKLQVWSGLDHY